MAKTKISQYDATAANNTDIDSINIAEGMAPSNVNNAIRELMAHLKDMDAGTQALTSPQLTSADINGGTIDGVTIGGASAGVGTFTNLTATGTTTLAGASTSADITFGDNDKAIFGAGSDLEIYHDGSDSFIKENGTGNLKVRASAGVYIQKYDGTEDLATFLHDDGVYLYHNGNLKLATTSTGIDVTGTVTADGLTVDGDAEISSALPILYLSETDATDLNTRIRNSVGRLQFQTTNDAKSSSTTRLNIDHSTGDISFYEDTGTTAKLFWSAADESLGIGTSSPTQLLHLNKSTGNVVLSLQRGTGTASIGVDNGGSIAVGSNAGDLVIRPTGTTGVTRFTNSAGAIKMSLLESGNVGIGTSSPATAYKNALQVHGADGGGNIRITNDTTGTGTGNGFEAVVVGIDAYLIQREAAPLIFYTNNSEAMRIDSSGNLLVGMTGANSNTRGAYLDGDGFVSFTRDNNRVMVLGRGTGSGTDGDILEFRKDGSTVGSIGTTSSRVILESGGSFDNHAGFRLYASNGAISRAVEPYYNSSNSDGEIDLGRSTSRFKDLYLSGTINKTAGLGTFAIETSGSSSVNLNASNSMKFTVGNTDSHQFVNGSTEAMRINSSGRVGIGITSIGARLHVQGEAGDDTAIFRNGSDAGNGISIQRTDGTEVGSINWASSSTSFNTSSDYRLKENVIELTGATARLKLLEPKRFNFISDADTTVDGFLAHEVQTVVPEAIHGTHNEVDADGNPVYQGIDHSKLVPLLVATIKELEARITALENA